MIDFHPKHRELTGVEKNLVANIKAAAVMMDLYLEQAPSSGAPARHIAIARTHLETAVMFAVKAVTA